MNEWLNEMLDHSRRILHHNRTPEHVQDDILQQLALRILTNPAQIDAYHPRAFARAATVQTSIDLVRTDNIQRGSGKTALRQIVSINVENFDSISTCAGFEDEVVGRVDMWRILRNANSDVLEHAAILAADRKIFDEAARLGVARETLSRRIAASRRTLATLMEDQ
jgi:hypothetical protein